MKLFITLCLLVITLAYSKMDIPEATPVAANTIQVDMEKVEKLVADEQAKVLKEKLAHEKKLLSEKFQAEIRDGERLTNKRLQLEEDAKRAELRQKELEWQARNPEAVKAQDERARLEYVRRLEIQHTEDARRKADEQFKHQLKLQYEAEHTKNEILMAGKHREDFKLKVRVMSIAMIGAGVALFAYL